MSQFFSKQCPSEWIVVRDPCRYCPHFLEWKAVVAQVVVEGAGTAFCYSHLTH